MRKIIVTVDDSTDDPERIVHEIERIGGVIKVEVLPAPPKDHFFITLPIAFVGIVVGIFIIAFKPDQPFIAEHSFSL